MREKINLNRDWYFKEIYEDSDINSLIKDNYIKVDLPHTLKLMPYNEFNYNDYQIESSYKKIIELKKEEDKSYILTFLGIAQKSRIYVNKKLVKENNWGYNTIEIDITDELKDGVNEIYVYVSSKEENFPPFGNIVDYLGYGGIYRECYLYVTGKSYIMNPFFSSYDLLTEEKKYSLSVDVKGDFDGIIKYFVIDNKSPIIEDSFPLRESHSKNGALNSVKLWSIDDPYLYKIRIQLLDKDESLVDEIEFNYGFRDIKIDKTGLYLNGVKTILRGLDRHQAFPYVGYAMPESMQKLDADILKKELGLNAVRTSHYPQSQYFIDRCDEIGLLVFTEMPGWQHIGDSAWKEQAVENLREMVVQYRNHPSIMLWGVRINESVDDDEFYSKTNELAHKLDPTRQTGGVRCYKKGSFLEDVYTYNDFSHVGTNKGVEKKVDITSDMRKAYFVSEYNGHMFPTKAFDWEEHRLEHMLRHANVLDEVNAQTDIA